MSVEIELEFEPTADAHDAAFERYSDACEQSLHALLAQSDRHEAIGTAGRLARSLDRPAVRTAARHPLFRHWRSQLSALMATGDSVAAQAWLEHLPRFLLGAALTTTDDLPDIRVPLDREGQLRLPGLTRHLLLGLEPEGREAAGSVLVGRVGDAVRITQGGRTQELPLTTLVSGGPQAIEHPVLAGTGIELDATDPWFVDSITSANATSDSPLYRQRDIVPADAVGHRSLFERACALIGLAWPGCLAELATQVRVIVPISSRALAGWTTVTQLGAIYIRPGGVNTEDGPAEAVIDDPVMFTAEAMVHEGGHTRLQVLSLGRPLFLDGAQHRPLRSPLRKDARPAGGVYHAAFVLARMATFLRRAAVATGRSHYLARATECHQDLKEASDELFAHVALSPAGRRLLEEAVAAADAAYAGNRTASGVMS